MESGLQSRKRKHQSSKSGGIFTRSNSQFYLHGLRSGHARADSVETPNLIQSLEGKTKSTVEQEPWGCPLHQITSVVSVKDLRAKRIFPPATITDEELSVWNVDWEADLDVHKTNEGTTGVSSSGHGDLRVSPSVADDLKPSRRSVDSSLIRENNVMEAGESVMMAPRVSESDQNKEAGEKNGTSSVANEIVDTQGSMSKSQSPLTSSRGRKKVFLSSSSFSCRRLRHYLTDPRADDSSNFEIVEPTSPKVQKSSNVVACEGLDIDAVPNSNKLGLPAVMQKSHEDVFNNSLVECQQMTPPDSDIYTIRGVPESNNVVSASKLVLKSCSRMNMLQTPTSFSHRRLLPYLMSVSGDDSWASKDNQSSKPENTSEQNEQPPTPSLSHQNISIDESKINKKSDSPISTSTLYSSDNLLDTDGSNTKCTESNELPKKDLKCVEEVNSIETSADESPCQSLQIAPVNAPGINGEKFRNGILKRTPRGCRGICNCLNCTSFRLHAERSFEFSRNQMHDAEEVALELINDLTSLRNILEKTASDSDDAVKEKEVKEVCAKALYKEEVARARLAQMNKDLSFHCRNMPK